jgi:photosystem II stability/assembly factor-like uncharacterized protein
MIAMHWSAVSRAARGALAALLVVGVAVQAQTLAPATYRQMQFRYVGPPGNKVVAVAGVAGDPSVAYAGTPSGGVFKSTDGGFHWTPIFDSTGIASIGAIAVARSNPDVVWVGTGDPFVRENVSIGDGVYKSTDAGRTWTHVGLEGTGRIARVVIHPTDPNTVFIAAVGIGYAPHQERGVYRTRDGGKSWQRVLFIDENTGAADVVMDPTNPEILFAATWQITMGPGGTEAGGPGSAIYRSRDGGTTWTKLTKGLPSGPLGKIGLGISRKDPKRVYALISTPGKDNGSVWRSEDGGSSWTLRSRNALWNTRAVYFSRIGVFPDNADEVWFLAQSTYVSTDGGETAKPLLPLFPDQHDIWIDPQDPNRVIIANDRYVHFTMNRGKSWRSVDLPNSQVYRVGTDRQVPYDLFGHRHDGPGFWGPSNSLTEAPGGNGPVPLPGRFSGQIAENSWQAIPGASEVGYSLPDPVDDSLVWVLNGGTFGLLNMRTGQSRNVAPWPVGSPGSGGRGGDPSIRHSAFALATSAQLPHKVYVGSQYVYETADMGRTWTTISPDLTANSLQAPTGPWPDGKVASAIFSLAVSPIERGVVWSGSTDGQVYVTRNDGQTWTNVTRNLSGLGSLGTVTSIEASHYAPGLAYLTVDRHKSDDRNPYIYKTADYGAHWQLIVSGVPRSAVSYARVIKEDPRRQDLLYLGTEGGLFISADAGASWLPFNTNLPRVPVSWITVQEDFNDLVLSTFGRGFWILDDITPLQQLTPAVLQSADFLFDPRPAYLFVPRPFRDAVEMGLSWAPASNVGSGPPDGTPLSYYLRAPAGGPVRLTILDDKNVVVRVMDGPSRAGINRVWWNFERDGGNAPTDSTSASMLRWHTSRVVAPGVYTVKLSVDGHEHVARLSLMPDPHAPPK